MPPLRHALIPAATCLTVMIAGLGVLPRPARAEPAPAERSDLEAAANEQLIGALAATWQAFVDRPRTYGRWEVLLGTTRVDGDWKVDGSNGDPVILVALASETVCSVGRGSLSCRHGHAPVVEAALADLPASSPAAPLAWPRALVRWDCVKGTCHAVTIGSVSFAPAARQPTAEVAQLRRLYPLVMGSAIDASGMFAPLGKPGGLLEATVVVTRPLPYQAVCAEHSSRWVSIQVGGVWRVPVAVSVTSERSRETALRQVDRK